MKRFITAILCTVLLSGCFHGKVISWAGDIFKGGPEAGEPQSLPGKDIVLETGFEKIRFTVEVADDEAEREQGLMYRTKLADGRGMWFDFKDEAPRSFWMKNTLIPLDIIFFSSKREAVKIIQGMEPCRMADCTFYYSGSPAMFALELPAGYAEKHGIKIGDKIIEE